MDIIDLEELQKALTTALKRGMKDDVHHAKNAIHNLWMESEDSTSSDVLHHLKSVFEEALSESNKSCE